MFYTLFFYIITLLLASQIHDRKKAMRAVFTFAAAYMSLRYDYPSDYPAYKIVFEEFSAPSFDYFQSDTHMEYGWYLINRLFSYLGTPLGYYVFVAFCSCIFARGLYLITDIFVPKKYLPVVVLGLFVMGNFATLLSAQRQLIVAGIFMIAYSKLIYNKINGWMSLFGKRTILYFAIIFMCYYFHKSSLFLMIVPFLYLLPKKSLLVVVGLLVAGIFFFYSEAYLVEAFEFFQEQAEDYYSNMIFSGEWSGEASILQIATWLFQYAVVVLVYLKYNCTKDEHAVLFLSMLVILIIIAGFSLGQFARLAHFIYAFSFMAIPVVANKIRDTSFYKPYMFVNCLWILWNAMKVFSIPRGTLYEYKFLLFNL